jgi:hypothetical protein
MSAIPLDAILGETGTASSVKHGQPNRPFGAHPAVRRSFTIVGGLTGASSAPFPLEVFDPTSADVIELEWPILAGEGYGMFGVPRTAGQPPATVEHLLAVIKDASGLTWGQIADAMGVEPRAIHLWRRGGGISAAREERLQELNALVDSIDFGDPAGVRTELLEVGTSGASLLERLRSGESPREVSLLAPWRSRTRAELDHNLSERRSDGVVDEDYLFLLYLDDAAITTFAEHATDTLEDPMATPRSWASLIDTQFASMQQPDVVEVEAEVEGNDYDEGGIKPLFSPADLGVPLGLGAIASRRALHENP